MFGARSMQHMLQGNRLESTIPALPFEVAALGLAWRSTVPLSHHWPVPLSRSKRGVTWAPSTAPLGPCQPTAARCGVPAPHSAIRTPVPHRPRSQFSRGALSRREHAVSPLPFVVTICFFLEERAVRVGVWAGRPKVHCFARSFSAVWYRCSRSFVPPSLDF